MCSETVTPPIVLVSPLYVKGTPNWKLPPFFVGCSVSLDGSHLCVVRHGAYRSLQSKVSLHPYFLPVVSASKCSREVEESKSRGVGKPTVQPVFRVATWADGGPFLDFPTRRFPGP